MSFSGQKKQRPGCLFGSYFQSCRGLACLGTLILCGTAAAYLALWAMGGFLIVSDPLVKSDAVLVLSGGGDLDRLQEAVKIYKAKYAPLLILTETGETVPSLNTPYSAVVREDAMGMGVAPGDITITDRTVSSTYEEARVTYKLLLKNGMKSVIVVTDPFHSRRAQVIFDDVFKSSDIKVTIHPVSADWYRASTWWMSSSGRLDTLLEYSKLVGYLAGFKQA
ncbi:MAG: YdcF family protein [Anaerolineaceae bacterium]|nr:YdcF family protein [Anaerolineaceae bacterium]